MHFPDENKSNDIKKNYRYTEIRFGLDYGV